MKVLFTCLLAGVCLVAFASGKPKAERARGRGNGPPSWSNGRGNGGNDDREEQQGSAWRMDSTGSCYTRRTGESVLSCQAAEFLGSSLGGMAGEMEFLRSQMMEMGQVLQEVVQELASLKGVLPPVLGPEDTTPSGLTQPLETTQPPFQPVETTQPPFQPVETTQPPFQPVETTLPPLQPITTPS